MWGPIDPIGTIRMGKGWAYGPIPRPRIRAYSRTISKGRNKNFIPGRGKEYLQKDLTVFEDNDNLGTFVRGGQGPSQSLNVAH